MSFGFPKKERLTAKKDIEGLFGSGQAVRKGVLSLKWIVRDIRPEELSRQVLIAVPKRNVKLAVDRNRIKRQLRELYRLNKDLWKNDLPSNKMLAAGVIYLGKAGVAYDDLEKDYKGLLLKFQTALKRMD